MAVGDHEKAGRSLKALGKEPPGTDMDSVIASGIVGAVVGAVFTAGGTWAVSVRLDRQRDSRRLIAAIGVVAAEIEENANRLSRSNARLEDLTLGDWTHNKPALAALALRNDPLWTRVVSLYGEIFEAQLKRGTPPSATALRDTRERLLAEYASLEREIRGFSSARRRPRG
jgi:hypothetical protein